MLVEGANETEVGESWPWRHQYRHCRDSTLGLISFPLGLGLALPSRAVYHILSLQRYFPYFIQVQLSLWCVGIQTSVS